MGELLARRCGRFRLPPGPWYHRHCFRQRYLVVLNRNSFCDLRIGNYILFRRLTRLSIAEHLAPQGAQSTGCVALFSVRSGKQLATIQSESRDNPGIPCVNFTSRLPYNSCSGWKYHHELFYPPANEPPSLLFTQNGKLNAWSWHESQTACNQ